MDFTYAEFILNELGGKAKAQQVIEYARKANPKIDKKTIANAISGKLSKLFRENKIGADTDFAKSEGYEYFTKDWVDPNETNNLLINDFINKRP